MVIDSTMPLTACFLRIQKYKTKLLDVVKADFKKIRLHGNEQFETCFDYKSIFRRDNILRMLSMWVIDVKSPN